jgi:hypothetical protein
MRPAIWLGTVASLVVGSVLAMTVNASALTTDLDVKSPSGLSTWQTVLIFVCLPVGMWGLIGILVYATSRSGGSRRRAGEAWEGTPAWFGGPKATSANAIESAAPTSDGGGSSAEW